MLQKAYTHWSILLGGLWGFLEDQITNGHVLISTVRIIFYPKKEKHIIFLIFGFSE